MAAFSQQAKPCRLRHHSGPTGLLDVPRCSEGGEMVEGSGGFIGERLRISFLGMPLFSFELRLPVLLDLPCVVQSELLFLVIFREQPCFRASN